MREGRRVGLNVIFNTLGGVWVQVITILTGIFVARHFARKVSGN